MNPPGNEPTASSAKAGHLAAGGEIPPRRPFFIRLAALAVGGLAGLVPLAAGLTVLLDPLLRRRQGTQGLVRVASVDAIPQDGAPRRFPVIMDRDDAWSHYPAEPVGAVFISRDRNDGKLRAFSAVCPHLGCGVQFKSRAQTYQCPCHNSAWEIDGSRIDPENCPAPRGLDELEIEVRNDTEVWVSYKRFRSGIAEQVEV